MEPLATAVQPARTTGVVVVLEVDGVVVVVLVVDEVVVVAPCKYQSAGVNRNLEAFSTYNCDTFVTVHVKKDIRTTRKYA